MGRRAGGQAKHSFIIYIYTHTHISADVICPRDVLSLSDINNLTKVGVSFIMTV